MVGEAREALQVNTALACSCSIGLTCTNCCSSKKKSMKKSRTEEVKGKNDDLAGCCPRPLPRPLLWRQKQAARLEIAQPLPANRKTPEHHRKMGQLNVCCAMCSVATFVLPVRFSHLSECKEPSLMDISRPSFVRTRSTEPRIRGECFCTREYLMSSAFRAGN